MIMDVRYIVYGLLLGTSNLATLNCHHIDSLVMQLRTCQPVENGILAFARV